MRKNNVKLELFDDLFYFRSYDIATDFYGYGWGESFHFPSLGRGETKKNAIAKHEYRSALKLRINPSKKVLVSKKLIH